MEPKVKKIIFIVGFIILAIFVYAVISSISHIGKVKVNIDVLPENADVYINDKKESSNSIYLSPGTYTFTAKLDGYTDDTQKIDVTKESSNVVLLPTPESDEAKAYFQNNPQLQAQKERLGGQRAISNGTDTRKKYPIIAKLPYIDILGPFSLDYGPSTTHSGNVTLFVSDSSPDGRRKALQWIRENNEEPTNYEIVFSDYQNPLAIQSRSNGLPVLEGEAAQ